MTVTSRGLYAYLTILTGNRAGTNFPLDARRDTLIGRGTDCHISLPDPLCSRVHATLTFTPDGWVIRDAESRNGTLVNGQKIDEATVVDGNTIRVGSAEFEFHESEEPPTAKGDDPQLMQTIVQDLPIAVQESHEDALAGLPSTEQVKELMLLYQLCIKLLGCGDPNRVLEIALDLLRKRTNASVVGFLSVNDEGSLAAKDRHPARCGESRHAQPIAHRARLATGPRRVGRQSGLQRRHPRLGPLRRCRLRSARSPQRRWRTHDARRHPRLSRRRPLSSIGFRLHHLRRQHRRDRARSSPRTDDTAKRLPAPRRKVARLRRADRQLPVDARSEVEDQSRRRARRAACSSAAKVAPARSSSPGPFTARARAPIGRWSRSTAQRSRPT